MGNQFPLEQCQNDTIQKFNLYFLISIPEIKHGNLGESFIPSWEMLKPPNKESF